MKITRIGPSFPLLTASTLGGAGGSVTPSVGSGLVPISTGSNSWAWGGNVQTISAGGSNVTGPFVNFAAGSNVTLTIDQVGAIASNTIRIHATTSAASFGSNSNAVSQANAPGASTDSSRADHVHLGVTSLAHSSNTFSGPVILTASGTLGITSPTPGTYNLSGGSGGASGALVLLAQQTAAASATLDFTTFISSTYDEYEISFVNLIPATNNVNLYMRMGTGGGPTWDTGNNYGSASWEWRAAGSATGGAEGGQAFIALIRNLQQTTANWALAGNIRLTDPGGALFKTVAGKFVYRAVGFRIGSETIGTYESTTAVTGVRFYYSSGNIASGSIRVYGIAK